MRVDLHHRQERRERDLEREEVAELLFDHVADHPLGLGAEDVEGKRLHIEAGRRLEGEESDLRPVPVRDDELVLPCHGRQSLGGSANVRPLVLRCHRLAAAEKRVPSEGDDDPHVKASRGPGPAAPQSPPLYISSIRPLYFWSMIRRFTLSVGVSSPPSIVRSFGRREKRTISCSWDLPAFHSSIAFW